MGDRAGRSHFGRNEDDGTGNKIVLGCLSNGHGRCFVRNGDLLFLAMTGHGDGPTIDAFDGEIANNVPGTEFVLCPGDWHLFADMRSRPMTARQRRCSALAYSNSWAASEQCLLVSGNPRHLSCASAQCGCGGLRAFQSSGKIRLNANGRKLDAWLIYKCLTCEKTWNRPIFERQNVRDIDPVVLDALESNDPQWIQKEMFNLEALRRKSQRVDEFSEFDMKKHFSTELTNGRNWK